MSLDETIAAVVRTVLADQLADLVTVDNVFTLRGAARYMATSEKVVKQLIAQGDLPCLRVGREYRIGRRPIDELMARGAVIETEAG